MNSLILAETDNTMVLSVSDIRQPKWPPKWLATSEINVQL